MKEEIMEKWATALESGDYKQGRGRLRGDNDKFCCLGVLCDLMDPKGWDFVNDHFDAGTLPTKVIEWADINYCGNAGFLPTKVAEWADIHPAGSSGGDHFLSQMNDRGASFKEIASVIRENWRDL